MKRFLIRGGEYFMTEIICCYDFVQINKTVRLRHEQRYNEPLYTEVPGLTNDIFSTRPSYSKMNGIKRW